MLKRLSNALHEAGTDRLYNIILVLILITMSLSLISSSPFIFAIPIVLSIVEIGIIIKFILKGKHNENNK